MSETTPGLAEFIGTNSDGRRQWLVEGKVVDDDGLEEIAAKQWRREYGSQALLDRELGESLVGLDLHKAALADLKTRGIRAGDESQDEYLAAVARVSP